MVAEYLYDARGVQALTPFQDDVFLGVRVALNDVKGSDVLAGLILDRNDGSGVYKVESSRRVGNSWTLALEARGFWGPEKGHFLHDFQRDDYVSLGVTRGF